MNLIHFQPATKTSIPEHTIETADTLIYSLNTLQEEGCIVLGFPISLGEHTEGSRRLEEHFVIAMRVETSRNVTEAIRKEHGNMWQSLAMLCT